MYASFGTNGDLISVSQNAAIYKKLFHIEFIYKKDRFPVWYWVFQDVGILLGEFKYEYECTAKPCSET